VSQDRYKEAGVDIDAGAELVRRIAPAARSTSRPEVLGGLGHFGALWSVPAGRFKDLVLVSATDGVGTKIKIAQATGVHDTIGIDLVAMCVNDVICTGAEPFFFLDYLATGRLEVDVAEALIGGIAEGCRQANCALVGGETAEMPGVYGAGVYDLAGFAVGGVERERVLDGSGIRRGMKLVGLDSVGLHSNGYSLARRVLLEEQGMALDAPFPGTGRTVGEELLLPTRIYVKPVLRALREFEVGAVCHVTGGGLTDNLPRVLRPGASARVDLGSWTVPPIFEVLREAGEIPQDQMLRTFNFGIGLVLAVDPDQAEELCDLVGAMGAPGQVIGEIVRGDEASEVVFA